jgi:hypothetical protein
LHLKGLSNWLIFLRLFHDKWCNYLRGKSFPAFWYALLEALPNCNGYRPTPHQKATPGNIAIVEAKALRGRRRPLAIVFRCGILIKVRIFISAAVFCRSRDQYVDDNDMAPIISNPCIVTLSHHSLADLALAVLAVIADLD